MSLSRWSYEEMKIVFVHAGRLTKEKWSDEVVELCKWAQNSDYSDLIEVHIFWAWTYASEFEQIATTYSWVIMHWFQPRDKLFATRDQSHYTLLPSNFLETFGLSALEACTYWSVPIGYKKWWLDQFVDTYYAIDTYWWIIPCVQHLVKQFIDRQRMLESRHVQKIAARYTARRWLYTFQELSWLNPYQWHTITMISDYWTREWWIESYIHDVSALLMNNWYTVTSVLWTKTKRSTLQNYWWVVKALWTRSWKEIVSKHLTTHTPDLLRRHSIHRVLWWKAFSATSHTTPQRYMLHDVWLLHPRPSRVHMESQLKHSHSLRWRVAEWWVFMSLFSLLKWYSIRASVSSIQTYCDYVLVPSSFLEHHCVTHWLWTTSNVKTFAHTIETTTEA